MISFALDGRRVGKEVGWYVPLPGGKTYLHTRTTIRDDLKEIYGCIKYKYVLYQGILTLLITLNIYFLNAFRLLDLYFIILGLVLIILIASFVFFYFFYLYRNVNGHSFIKRYTDEKIEKTLKNIMHVLKDKNISFKVEKKLSILGKEPIKIISFPKGKIMVQSSFQNRLMVTAEDDQTSLEIISKIVSQ